MPTEDYLLDHKIKMFQSPENYRTSSDAVLVASLVHKLKKNDNILDVGAGLGGVSLCLAHRFTQNSITGLEIQPELLALAQKNAQANGFGNLQYFQNDIRDKKTLLPPCSFAHVISNPPYLTHQMRSPNQSKALAHNHQNFSLSGWIKFCLKMLKPYGHLYLINRPDALEETIHCLYTHAGNIRILPVFSKKAQNAKRILLMAQKDSKTPTSILPPLYIHQEDGSYTPEAEKILRTGLSYFDL